MGESADAPKWAALARAHHHRANQLLSPDGYYYEGLEYRIFSMPVARALLRRVGARDRREPVGARARAELEAVPRARAAARRPERVRLRRHLGRARSPARRAAREYDRVYPGGTLQSNFNVMYRVAARLQRPAGAGGRRALRAVRPQQPRGVLDAALARPRVEGRADDRAPARSTTSRTRASSTTAHRGTPTPPRSRSRRARPKATASRGCSRRRPSGASTAATRIPTPAASSSGRVGDT